MLRPSYHLYNAREEGEKLDTSVSGCCENGSGTGTRISGSERQRIFSIHNPIVQGFLSPHVIVPAMRGLNSGKSCHKLVCSLPHVALICDSSSVFSAILAHMMVMWSAVLRFLTLINVDARGGTQSMRHRDPGHEIDMKTRDRP